MERIAMRIREDALDPVLDRLLPLLPGGVHASEVAGEPELVELAAYDEPDRLPAIDTLRARVGDRLVGEVERTPVPLDWRERRRIYGRGVTVGGLHLRSPYDRDPEPDLVDVVIGAGEAAFGGGAHITTQLMLALIEELEPTGGFADLGCGTGALAIAAAKLGFAPVLALDHDERSVAATTENAALNGVALEIAEVDLATAPAPAQPVLAANIPPAVHRNVAATLDPCVRHVLVSGLLAEDAQLTLDVYLGVGLRVVTHVNAEAWSAALLERPA